MRPRQSGFCGVVSTNRKPPRDYLEKWPYPELKPVDALEPDAKAMAQAALVIARVALQITVARRTLEWTQPSLGREAGVSAGTISRLENGDTWTDVDVLVRVGLALGVELDVIWSESRRSVSTARERD